MEFDDDLNLEINGVRCDKAGNNIGLYDRNEKRPDDNQGFFQVEQVGSGDQVLAVKPWIGAIVAPENGQQL